VKRFRRFPRHVVWVSTNNDVAVRKKMTEKTRILFLSANPWTTSRILVDEEAREIFERIQEGPYRQRFELHKHTATRPVDLQRLLLLYQPHIVHFSGHGSKKQKIILGGAPGRGKTIDCQGLVELFALYNNHVRLVLLNACFTKIQARSLSQVIDYSVGTGNGIGDKAGVAFAGAFYRALGFGKSIRESFESAKAELGLTKMPRTQGIELFVREGISGKDPFPQVEKRLANLVWRRREERSETQIIILKTSCISYCSKRIQVRRHADVIRSSDDITSDLGESCGVTAAPCTSKKEIKRMPVNMKQQTTGSGSAATLRKSDHKPTGTRAGTLEDWRDSSKKSGKVSGGLGKTLRDGR
jgi:hypothetical protein